MPGDVLVGDDDGVVVVPASQSEEVLVEARKRAAMEEDWYRRLDKGESTINLLDIRPV
jgi:4-hydroxy-4-methyl-2-oxoglutarate aldolase